MASSSHEASQKQTFAHTLLIPWEKFTFSNVVTVTYGPRSEATE